MMTTEEDLRNRIALLLKLWGTPHKCPCGDAVYVCKMAATGEVVVFNSDGLQHFLRCPMRRKKAV